MMEKKFDKQAFINKLIPKAAVDLAEGVETGVDEDVQMRSAPGKALGIGPFDDIYQSEPQQKGVDKGVEKDPELDVSAMLEQVVQEEQEVQQEQALSPEDQERVRKLVFEKVDDNLFSSLMERFYG